MTHGIDLIDLGLETMIAYVLLFFLVVILAVARKNWLFLFFLGPWSGAVLMFVGVLMR